MGKKKSSDDREDGTTIGVRVPLAMFQDVETWRQHLEAERPGTQSSLSDSVRTLIAMALELPEVKKATR